MPKEGKRGEGKRREKRGRYSREKKMEPDEKKKQRDKTPVFS